MKNCDSSFKKSTYTQGQGFLEGIKAGFYIFINQYGLLGLLACVAVLFKFYLFYDLVRIENKMSLILVSALIVLLSFSAFKRKKIMAFIYLIISLLLLADALYFSYFSKYLSFQMIGAAEVLGDITESIKAILNPKLLLLFVDNIFIFAALSKRARGKVVLPPSKLPEISLQLQNPTANKCLQRVNGLIHHLFSENGAFVRLVGRRKLRVYGIYKNPRQKVTYIRYAFTKKIMQPVIIFLLAAVILWNPFGFNSFTALSNQEIFNYRVRDTVALFVKDKMTRDVENLTAFTDSYHGEIDGSFFGAAKGRNLIIIQVESLQNFVINYKYNGQEITPNLNKLLSDNTTYFSNYYQQVGTGNTSDAEFATNNSIYGCVEPYTYKLYGEHNYFRGLPKKLADLGYQTAVFHPYEDMSFWNREKTYPNMGFETFYGGLDDRGGYYRMDDWLGWGLSDKSFYRQSRKYFADLEQPFYAMVITLSNHHPYKMQSHEQRIKLKKEDKGTIVGNYLNSVAYTDKYLGEFFKQLKRDGLYDNSVIAIYGDHVGLAHSEETDEVMERLLGKKYDFDTMLNIPLIISMPRSKTNIRQTIDVAGGQMDFYPTIAYLFGIEDLDTVYFGHNLYSVKKGFVIEKTHMLEGSFFTNDVAFSMSRDGVFEHSRAWNYKTGKKLDPADFKAEYEHSILLSRTCEHILKNDVLRDIYM